MSSFIQKFKAFAMRGNVVDLAVGIIIGAAFGKIVSSLVADIIMPPIGVLVGGVKFNELKVPIKAESVNAAGEKIEAVTLNYGNFIQATVDFIIVAFAIFLIVELMAKMQKKEQETPT
ncbi:MAG: large-conductance mechanosensitive channel protein MscL, partial [Cytophagaceae bacterium]|nr:large-conductance mechanosensitive channel protein MscL [Cytophagaceae bacterium]